MAEPERIERWQEPVRREEATGGAESVGATVKELLSDIGDLFRSELRLARAEVRVDLSTAGRAAALAAAGGVVALLGVAYLLLAAVYGLATAMSLWLAALIVGLVVLVVGAVLVWVGVRNLRQVSPVPEETIRTLQEDAEWLRNRRR